MIPDVGINSFLFFPSNDSFGCTRDENIPAQSIAVVLRGKCSFVQKITNLQASGILFVIVGNDQPHQGLMCMNGGHGASRIYIPSTFITNEDFLYIKKIYEFRRGLLPVLVTRNSSDSSFMTVLILGMMGPLFILTCFYTLCAIQRALCMYFKREECKKALLSTPLDHISVMDGRLNDHCMICLDDYQVGQVLRIMPCQHAFHKSCLDTWFQYGLHCPLCKRLP